MKIGEMIDFSSLIFDKTLAKVSLSQRNKVERFNLIDAGLPSPGWP